MLVGGARSATPRQQTLQASVDWSYELLQDDERTLLRRLAVFAGSATLDAVEAVCEGDGLERLSILDLLTGLVDKSLVMVDDDGPVARYRLLETIRQYGALRLADSGDEARVRTRHRDVHLALAERIEPRLFGAEQEHATAELHDVHANLPVAFDWSRDRSDTDEMLRFVAALFYYFIVRGMVSQGRRWASIALAGAARTPSCGPGRSWPRGTSRSSPATPPAPTNPRPQPSASGRTAATGGPCAVPPGLWPRCWPSRTPPPAFPAWRATSRPCEDADAWWLSEGLCNLGAAQFTAGDAAGARASSREALAVTELSGDVFERRQALCFTGFLAAVEGDLARSLDVVVPLMDDARATHDTATLPLALAALALAHT